MSVSFFKNSIIFTGAGFSKPAGCKLSREILTELFSSKDLFSSTERELLRFISSSMKFLNTYESFPDMYKSTATPASLNIESLLFLLRRLKYRERIFPYPLSGNWSERLIFLEQEHKDKDEGFSACIYTSIEEKIRRKYPEWLQYNPKKLNFLEPLRNLLSAKSSEDKILHWFTLNHDLVIEEYEYFKKEGTVFRGFVRGEWRGFELHKEDMPDSRIYYYKLHGSLDWYQYEDGKVVLEGATKDEVSTSEENNERKNNLFILGYNAKQLTIEPFVSLMYNFQKILSDDEKKVIFVIGYSFFDPHINNMLFSALINREKTMVIINPETNMINLNSREQAKDLNAIPDTINCGTLKEELKCMGCIWVNIDGKSYFKSHYIANVQSSPLLSMMPEWNIREMNPEQLIFIPVKTEEFIEKMFCKYKSNKFLIDIFVEEIINNVDKGPF